MLGMRICVSPAEYYHKIAISLWIMDSSCLTLLFGIWNFRWIRLCVFWRSLDSIACSRTDAWSHPWVSPPSSSPSPVCCPRQSDSNTCRRLSLKACPDGNSLDSWNPFPLSTTLLVSQEAVGVAQHALGSYIWHSGRNCQKKQMQIPPHALPHSWVSQPDSSPMSACSATSVSPTPPSSNTCIRPSVKVCPDGNSLSAWNPSQLPTMLPAPRDAVVVAQRALCWYTWQSLKIQRKQLRLKKPWQAKKTESTPKTIHEYHQKGAECHTVNNITCVALLNPVRSKTPLTNYHAQPQDVHSQ